VRDRGIVEAPVASEP